MTTLLFLFVLAAPDAGVDALRVEGDARQEALVKAGFNLTHGFGLGGGSTMRREFLVPPRAQSHRVSLWARAASGVISVRWISPTGPLASFESPSGEVTLDGPLAPGRYVLELDATRAGSAVAALGIKGSVTLGCAMDDAVSETPADPARGWHWPFLRYVPKQVKGPQVLVVPNNSGFVSDDLELLRASGRCELQRARALADQLGVTLLVPLFPRPAVDGEEDNLYLHALSRAALTVTTPALARVDRQLLAMLDSITSPGANGAGKVFLWGFSASGSFVNRFTLLHPQRVAAVAVGAPGGWPTVPVAKDGDEPLPWPVGIADVAQFERFDLTALAKVRFFVFRGADDANDSVPYRDSFSKSDEAQIERLFGKTPAARWPRAEALFRRAGVDVTFKLYPGVGHTVTDDMQRDVLAHFRRAGGISP